MFASPASAAPSPEAGDVPSAKPRKPVPAEQGPLASARATSSPGLPSRVSPPGTVRRHSQAPSASGHCLAIRSPLPRAQHRQNTYYPDLKDHPGPGRPGRENENPPPQPLLEGAGISGSGSLSSSGGGFQRPAKGRGCSREHPGPHGRVTFTPKALLPTASVFYPGSSLASVSLSVRRPRIPW